MLLAPTDKVIVPSYSLLVGDINTQKYAYVYTMGFLCIIYVHMYNLYSISECLSRWLIRDLIYVKILKNIFKNLFLSSISLLLSKHIQ